MSGLLDRVKRHHQEAFSHITTALQIDEDVTTSDKMAAVEGYRRGVTELELGVAIGTLGASPGDKEKINRLQAKMMKNLELAKERLSVLTSNESAKVKNKVHLPAAGQSGSTSRGNSVSTSRGNSVSTSRGNSGSTSRGNSGSTSRGNSGSTSRGNSGSTSRGNSGSTSRGNSRSTSNGASSSKPRVNSGSTPRSNSGSRSNLPPMRKNSESKDSNRTWKQLKSVPKELATRIMDTSVDPSSNPVKFTDIAGQEAAKQALQEMVILPALRPDLFSGLRSPAKGLLLFGPPGNGKTLLAKAVASEAKSVFFNISAATLTSKWVGEGEKMVRALFAVARHVQPSIVFIDEVDSLLRTRQENEGDATRRLQTEFLLQFDGVGSDPTDRVLVMGATNRPHELDDAALRRFPKRIYVKLPDLTTRGQLLTMLLKKHDSPLKRNEIEELSRKSANYSFSDLTDLAKDASLGPIREIPRDIFTTIDANKMRKINSQDFHNSLKKIRPSVSMEMLKIYESWNGRHGDTSDS